MWMLVGSRLRNLAAAVLAAGVFIFGLIQYGRQTQKHKQEVKDLKDYKETRERIDEVEVSPDRDAALDRLRRNNQLR
jgi:uncharacterized protein HemX